LAALVAVEMKTIQAEMKNHLRMEMKEMVEKVKKNLRNKIRSLLSSNLQLFW
jgi:hypothetical protein